MVEMDMALPHSYAVEEFGEFPGTGVFPFPVIYIPPPKTRPEHNGLWLKITPATGKSWIGVFAFGYNSPPAFCRVVSTLDPNRACIVSNGAAYIVKADEPELWEQIPILPVLDVRTLPGHGSLVFSDFTRLAAYGSNGLVWRSPRLCWDELKVLKVTHHIIEGTGYDPTNSISNEMRFIVDVRTGRSLLPSPTGTDGKTIW
jgi:hypothetical protein